MHNMKVARLDTLPRQDSLFTGGEPDGRYEKRQLIVVDDDYDFEVNDSTDVTGVENLKLVHSLGRMNYMEYRDALIVYAQTVTFSNLTTEQKEELCLNFAVDKSDRDSVFSEGDQKKHAKTIQKLVDEANEQITFDSKSMDIADESGIPDMTNISSSSAYGSYVAETSSEGESSTKDKNTYQTKLSLVTTSVSDGKYRIGWSFEVQGSDKDDIENTVTLNNSTVLMETNVEPGDKGNWIPSSGFKYETILEGIQTIDLKFKTTKDAVKIRRARLEIIKIT